MAFYRARFTVAGAGGGQETQTVLIPRQMMLTSVRAGGVDAANLPINNAAITADITIDGTERISDAAIAVDTFAGDGRQLVPLRVPFPVNNNISVIVTNNLVNALLSYDIVFECVDVIR